MMVIAGLVGSLFRSKWENYKTSGKGLKDVVRKAPFWIATIILIAGIVMVGVGAACHQNTLAGVSECDKQTGLIVLIVGCSLLSGAIVTAAGTYSYVVLFRDSGRKQLTDFGRSSTAVFACTSPLIIIGDILMIIGLIIAAIGGAHMSHLSELACALLRCAVVS